MVLWLGALPSRAQSGSPGTAKGSPGNVTQRRGLFPEPDGQQGREVLGLPRAQGTPGQGWQETLSGPGRGMWPPLPEHLCSLH